MGSGVVCEIDLSFTAPDRIRRNQEFILEFVKPVSVKSFEQAIRIIQALETNPSQSSPLLQWSAPENNFSKSLADIMDVIEFPLDWRIDETKVPRLTNEFYKTKDLIKKYLPQTSESIDKLIFSYLFAKRGGYEGGSVSSRIGMIWLGPTETWSTYLWAENIVHEFIHNALFLEDMVHQVFPYGSDVMVEEEALCISAIRKTRRGYDKSFHSAFVSLGLINFYQAISKQERSEKFIVPLIHCVEDLTKNERLLSAHGRTLLSELTEKTIHAAELLQ
ncbi:aKG-HExxH-type peptide beta-hydroxylase [Shewanella frigidimarina]|uniref:aKG-HExxH-type peptide beta-hydroxylase n=1 Tax=Shewanella frigidimarina TaxID=56812 RepID=UPI003D7BDA74